MSDEKVIEKVVESRPRSPVTSSKLGATLREE
jgi:hypothetical protein